MSTENLLKGVPNKEHLSIANEMAKEIINKPPELQNDMLICIISLVKERRKQMIEETEKNLVYLKESFQEL